MSDSLVRVSRRVEWGARWPARERAVAEARRGRALSATIGATAFAGISTARALAAASIRAGPRPEPIGGPALAVPHPTGRIAGPIRFPPDNFKHSLTLFSKSFSSFPRGTCSLSVSRPYLALDGIYRPIGAAFPNNPTRRQRLVVGRQASPGTNGALTLSGAPFQGTWARSPLRTLLQTTIRTAKPPDSQVGLFPVRLAGAGALWVQRECPERTTPERGTTAPRVERSTPPLVVDERRRRGSHFGPTGARVAHGEANVRPHATAAGGRRDAVTPRQTCPGLMASGAQLCVQKTRWFTGFCNSHQVSHFATFFIDARAEISVAESRFDIRETSPPPVHPRTGPPCGGRFVRFSLARAAPGVR
ncbi:UNVERIFIED_CONTAM: Protein TAR1 [Sesamum indicum]